MRKGKYPGITKHTNFKNFPVNKIHEMKEHEYD